MTPSRITSPVSHQPQFNPLPLLPGCPTSGWQAGDSPATQNTSERDQSLPCDGLSRFPHHLSHWCSGQLLLPLQKTQGDSTLRHSSRPSRRDGMDRLGGQGPGDRLGGQGPGDRAAHLGGHKEPGGAVRAAPGKGWEAALPQHRTQAVTPPAASNRAA